MDNLQAQKLIKRYYDVKQIYIDCEEIDEDLKTNVQPLNEFRAALDHVMRILLKDNGFEDGAAIDTDEEVRKAVGHFNRAYFDVCEMLCANFRLKIGKRMDEFSRKTILEVCPEYYTEIRPYIDSCEEKLADIRLKRGIEFGDKQEQLFNEIKEITFKLKDYYIKLIGASNQSQTYKKLKHGKRVNLIANIASYAIGAAGIIIGIIGWVI